MSYSTKRTCEDYDNIIIHNIKKLRKKSPPSTPSSMKRKIKVISMDIETDIQNNNNSSKTIYSKTYSEEEVNKLLEEALRTQKEELELIMEVKLTEQLNNISNYYLLHNNNIYNGKDCSYIN